MAKDSENLLVRVFFSHKYDAHAVNRYFYELLSSDGREVQFEIDKGTEDGKKIPTNVTRLERKIRDAEAFVGVYPLPADAGPDPPVDYLRNESQYLRLELDMAQRMGLPAIVFYDERYSGFLSIPPSITGMEFDSREIPGSVRSRIEQEFKECAPVASSPASPTGINESPRQSFRDPSL